MSKLKYTAIDAFRDEYLGKDYILARAKASDVSAYLINNLEKSNVDYSRFNLHPDMDDEKTPPTEIYEYQNFFLLERADRELVLLDGFRRLLYSVPPKHDILIRIYREVDMNREDIMKLMVYLNHFKFFGISKYYDRGFALAMYILFGLDIPGFRKPFDAYLRSTDRESYHNDTESVEDSEAVNRVTELMVDPLFIDNMTFLSEMSKTNQMVNSFFAIQFRDFSEKYKTPLTAAEFLAKVEGNKVLDDLLVKYKKYGTANTSDSTKVVRQIRQIYETVFGSFLGVDVDKPYAVAFEESKQASAELKKNKKWVKLTLKRDVYSEVRKMKEAVKSGKKVVFRAVVFPRQIEREWETTRAVVKPGVYDFTYVQVKQQKEWPYHEYLEVYLNADKEIYINARRSQYDKGFNSVKYVGMYDKKNEKVRVREVDADVYVCYE